MWRVGVREEDDGREKIPGFAKMKEKMEKARSFREEVKEYREVAAMKVLSVDDPWEMSLTTTRGGFSEEADAFLVLFVRVWSGIERQVALNGWNAWEKVRSLALKSPVLCYDYYLQTRTEEELSKRAEKLLRAVKKEQMETALRRKEQLEKEETSWREQLGKVEKQEESVKRRIEELTMKVEEMKKKVEEEKEKETSEQPTLRGLNLDKSTLMGLLPLFEELLPGMIGSRRELEVYFRQRYPKPLLRGLNEILRVVTEKDPRRHGVLRLRESLVDKTTEVMDLSKEMDVDEEIRAECERLARERKEPLSVVDVKAIVSEWERVEKERREKLFAMVEGTEGMTLEKLYEEESLKKLGITRDEMMRLASKVLIINKV